MKSPKQKVSLKSRAAEKAVSRREDRRRLENGESPEVIQRENSIFPEGYFERHKILNFSSAIGK
ncbi:MAG: hypothetical protein RI957_1541 [Verrucomicrobiota bacterium]|jgi:hypothetical protein